MRCRVAERRLAFVLRERWGERGFVRWRRNYFNGFYSPFSVFRTPHFLRWIMTLGTSRHHRGISRPVSLSARSPQHVLKSRLLHALRGQGVWIAVGFDQPGP